jgi:hypothetical protein
MDVVALIRTALPDRKYAVLKGSTEVRILERAARRTVEALNETFLRTNSEARRVEPDAETRERWAKRFRDAVRRLKEAGIETVGDESAGAEAYIAHRADWDLYLEQLAHATAHKLDEIDVAAAGKPMDREQSQKDLRRGRRARPRLSRP